jgi:iron complex outermembrane receptor protein
VDLHDFRLRYDRGFLIGGSVRYENYSDFGIIFLESKLSLQTYQRCCHTSLFSTGFRAPALHQIYSNIQTLVSGGKISNQGTFNNVDPAIGLGVPITC